MINASIDMLNHLGHTEHAKVIYDATYQTIVNDAIRTPGNYKKSFVESALLVFISFTPQIWEVTTAVPTWLRIYSRS